MDFTLTEEQDEIQAFARETMGRLATSYVAADHSYYTADDGPIWAGIATADLLALGLPESRGGSGGGVVENCLIAIEVGRAGLLAPYHASAVAASAVAAFGTADTAKAVLSTFIAGRAGLGVVAADARATADSLTVARDDAGWLVSGQVRHATVSCAQDSVLVPVVVDGTPQFALIELSRPGMSRDDVVATDLTHSSHLHLHEVTIGAADLVGQPGTDVWAWVEQRALAISCATQLGICSAALDLATRHVRDRRQFGRALADFQAVTQRLADASIDLQVLEVSTWRLASLLGQGRDARAEAHLAKYLAATLAPSVIRAAVHLHGGLGVDTSYPLTRLVLTSKRSELWMGGESAHLEHLADLIGQAETLNDLLTV